jgi:23S rRNA pseudouridine2457 synthase
MTNIILYKPYGTLCQFTREMPDDSTLADIPGLPPEVYPVGRLDKDSEGLLLLTDDKTLNARLLNPTKGHWRTYLVQVEGQPKDEDLEQLRSGIEIRIKKKTLRTRPARVRIIDPPPNLPERDPPVRFRKTVPDSWLEISLSEGKNRQVRRMCATAGFPVLRLVRFAIEDLKLGNLKPGEWTTVDGSNLRRLLHLR